MWGYASAKSEHSGNIPENQIGTGCDYPFLKRGVLNQGVTYVLQMLTRREKLVSSESVKNIIVDSEESQRRVVAWSSK